MTFDQDEKRKGLADPLASETSPSLTLAAQFDGRLQRYADARERALGMSDYIRGHVPPSPEKNRVLGLLETCGSYLVFRDYYTIGQVKLAGICSCKKHLICPLCAIRRGAKSVRAYLDKLKVIQQENPGLQAYLVTLTVKDGENLRERFTHLERSLKRYHRQRTDAQKGYRKPVEANKALGMVWSFEVKKGKNSRLWHPHAHAIWLCHERPYKITLAAEWQEITEDSFIVDVTPFHDQNNVSSGFLEVFKYAVKFSSMEYADTWEVYKTLSGRRLVNSNGLFRGVKIPESMIDEELPEDLPYIEMFYRFIRGSGYHIQKVDNVNGPPPAV